MGMRVQFWGSRSIPVRLGGWGPLSLGALRWVSRGCNCDLRWTPERGWWWLQRRVHSRAVAAPGLVAPSHREVCR